MAQMTIKETVIRESIDRAKERIEYLKSIINANPAIDIMSARAEGQKMIVKYQIEQLSQGTIGKKFKQIAEKERKAVGLMDLQHSKFIEYSSELGRITNELMQLNQELHFIEMKNE